MQETKPLPQAAIVVIRSSTRSRLWMLFSEVIKAKAEMEVAGDEVDAPSEPPVKQINDEASGEGNGEEEGTTETSESTRKQTTQATEKGKIGNENFEGNNVNVWRFVLYGRSRQRRWETISKLFCGNTVHDGEQFSGPQARI